MSSKKQQDHRAALREIGRQMKMADQARRRAQFEAAKKMCRTPAGSKQRKADDAEIAEYLKNHPKPLR